jgi:NAD(P)-dependent dehydrogenase (short-subunit alcohol dehydrogenase family)
MRLSGRRAVVTGGASGIGYAVAAALAQAGADIAVWSRAAGTPAARDALDRLRASGQRVLGVACDVSDEAAVAGALRRTLAEFDFIDIGVAAAGVNRRDPFPGTGLADIRRTLAVNLDGAFLTLRALAAPMAARGTGSLIAVGSIAARYGQAGTSTYAAGKAALGALVRTAAVELAGHGVRANLLTPGYTDTPLLRPYLADPRFTGRVRARIPLLRFADPAELGPAAVFLAGPGAAYVTGAEVVVDGGYTVNRLDVGRPDEA